MIEKYEEHWDAIREDIRLFEGIEPFKYRKDCIKYR